VAVQNSRLTTQRNAGKPRGEPGKRRQPRRGGGSILELVQTQKRIDLGNFGRELGSVLLDHAAGHDDAVDLAAILPLDLLEDGSVRKPDSLFMEAAKY